LSKRSWHIQWYTSEHYILSQSLEIQRIQWK